MPAFPFRVVTGHERASAPYPVDGATKQPFMIDQLSGDRWHHGGTIRQPVAEDFIRLQHPLPLPPVEEHGLDQDPEIIEADSYIDKLSVVGEQIAPHPFQACFSDQDLPVSEPASYFDEVPSQDEHSVTLEDTASAANTDRPKSVPNTLLRALNFVDSIPASQRSESPVRIPTMGSDTFSPALGGLHRLPSTPVRRPSKRERFKRFLLCDDRREYGHAPH
jgi:hypothetical protein